MDIEQSHNNISKIMKKINFIFVLLFLTFNNSLFSQENNCKTDSLPLYEITNKKVSQLLNSFIKECKHDHRYKLHKDSLIIIITFRLSKNQRFDVSFDLIINKNYNKDTLYIYENPYISQGFVKKDNLLIYVYFKDYFNTWTPSMLNDLLIKKGEIEVCLKEPPPDYFDLSISGEIEYRYHLLGWIYYFSEGKIIDKAEIIFENE